AGAAHPRVVRPVAAGRRAASARGTVVFARPSLAWPGAVAWLFARPVQRIRRLSGRLRPGIGGGRTEARARPLGAFGSFGARPGFCPGSLRSALRVARGNAAIRLVPGAGSLA